MAKCPVHNHDLDPSCTESLVGDCIRRELETMRRMIDLHTCPECGMLHRPGTNTLCPHTIAAKRDREEVERLTRELAEMRARAEAVVRAAAMPGNRNGLAALIKAIEALRDALATTTTEGGGRR